MLKEHFGGAGGCAYLVGVGHLPSTAESAVVIAHASGHGLDLGLLGVECIAVRVLFAAHWCFCCYCVGDEDCVGRTVDVGIDTQAEEVLVVVCVDTRVDFCSPRSCRLAWVEGVSVQNASELNLELDRAVLVEDPVDAVLVVGRGEDVADDQLACAGDGRGLIAEVGVLEKNACVFLVDADGVLDGRGFAGSVDEVGIHVVNRTLAITAEGQ